MTRLEPLPWPAAVWVVVGVGVVLLFVLVSVGHVVVAVSKTGARGLKWVVMVRKRVLRV